MSYGMTPYDFVRKMYFEQEGVILDFWPTDDKYKEAIMRGNLVLEELQKEEDWSWLRERAILGPCRDFRGDRSIPEFRLPPRFYKPATQHKDAVRLHPWHHRHCHGCPGDGCHSCGHGRRIIADRTVIQAKYRSTGSANHPKQDAIGNWGQVQVMASELNAVWTAGNIITFDRPLTHYEQACIAETDMIRRFVPMHICDHTCANYGIEDMFQPGQQEEARRFAFSCDKIEPNVLSEIPDPSYVVLRSASLHAEYSPPQQGRIIGLQDRAQKILSSMRQNEATQTTPDILVRETLDFFSVM